jgi:hypothetical protein
MRNNINAEQFAEQFSRGIIRSEIQTIKPVHFGASKFWWFPENLVETK